MAGAASRLTSPVRRAGSREPIRGARRHRESVPRSAPRGSHFPRGPREARHPEGGLEGGDRRGSWGARKRRRKLASRPRPPPSGLLRAFPGSERSWPRGSRVGASSAPPTCWPAARGFAWGREWVARLPAPSIRPWLLSGHLFFAPTLLGVEFVHCPRSPFPLIAKPRFRKPTFGEPAAGIQSYLPWGGDWGFLSAHRAVGD